MTWILVICLVGCGETTPDLAAPGLAEPTDEAAAKPIWETEDRQSVPSAEPTPDATVAEVSPAPREQKPVVPTHTPNTQTAPKVALGIPEPPLYLYKPEVLMSQRDADTCLVKVDDAFPNESLTDLTGQQRWLAELLGEKLTVIVLWSNEYRLGHEQIQRLESETVLPFRNSGLSVVAVNIGDPPEQLSELFSSDSELGFTVLVDPEATLFAKVATQRLPRTYLLDAEGRILWFDIEYSRGTTRDLANAIHVYLGNGKLGDS